MTAQYQAPRQVILSGLAGIEFGRPALICAINPPVIVTVFPSVKSKQDEETKTIAEAVKKNSPLNYRVDSQLNGNYELGRSSAKTVAMIGAFMEFYGRAPDNTEIVSNLAFSIDKKLKKTAWGFDMVAAAAGGLIYFRREFDFLKSIYKLPFKISQNIEDSLYLVESEQYGFNQTSLAREIGSLYNNKLSEVESILTELEKCTKRMVIAITKEDSKFFKDTLIKEEVFLEKLGIVSKKEKKRLKELSKFGSGKYEGVLVFYTDQKKEFEEFCQKRHINFLKFNPSYKGISKIK